MFYSQDRLRGASAALWSLCTVVLISPAMVASAIVASNSPNEESSIDDAVTVTHTIAARKVIAADQAADPRTMKAPMILAQEGTPGNEKLDNPDWKMVPGADVGKNPAETLMDVRHIVRKKNVVTFDVTGYKDFYSRFQGNCTNRQVRHLREGRMFEENTIAYHSFDNARFTKATAWERPLVDFACKQK